MKAAPGYWMHEQSGVLRPVMERFLNGSRLTFPEVVTMRAYLRQWIESPVWDENPYGSGVLVDLRRSVDSIVTHADIEKWLAEAFELGIDPL